jgi:DNA-binding winged helix-turn-helix (wHTH) protein/Tol biopolymer transport system component
MSESHVRFGAFTLDLPARKLWRDGFVVPLPSRAVDALVYLVANRHRAVEKNEVIAAVWKDVAVTDDSLTHAISVIRRTLGDDSAHPVYIETIPRRGYRFIGTVDAVDGTGESEAVLQAEPWRTTVIPPAPAVRWSWRALAGAMVLLLVIGAFALDRARLGTPSPIADALRVQQVAPPGTSIVSNGVVSPASRHLVFVARGEESGKTALWIRALDSAEPHLLPGTEGASMPFFSPDGRTIAFFMNGRLVATDLGGGRTRTIAAVHGAFAGGSWGADDVIVFADWTTGLYSVDATGGPVAPLTRLDHTALDAAHAWPQFLPDGRRFLYQVISGDNARAGVYAGSIDGGDRVRLLAQATAAAYAPPGVLLYLQHDMLMAEAFDADRLSLGGRAVLLARGVSAPLLTDGSVISGSREMLAFRQGASTQQLQWVDRAGVPQEALDVPTSMFNFRVSPDGRYLLAASSLTESAGLWFVDLARRNSTRLEADGIAPLWSPDGAQLAFTSRGGLDLYVRSRAGEVNATPLISDQSVKVLNDWSPDARHIVFTRHDPQTKLDLWTVPLSEGAARPMLQTSFNEVQARISPDGRWIAYASDESGTQEVYVQRYPALDGPRMISIGGGGQPQWRADQLELFYLSEDRSLMAVTVTDANRLSFGAPRRLFRTSIGNGPSGARESYAVSADGRSFLIDARRGADMPPPITVMLNWSAALTPAPAPAIASMR